MIDGVNTETWNSQALEEGRDGQNVTSARAFFFFCFFLSYLVDISVLCAFNHNCDEFGFGFFVRRGSACLDLGALGKIAPPPSFHFATYLCFLSYLFFFSLSHTRDRVRALFRLLENLTCSACGVDTTHKDAVAGVGSLVHCNFGRTSAASLMYAQNRNQPNSQQEVRRKIHILLVIG